MTGRQAETKLREPSDAKGGKTHPGGKPGDMTGIDKTFTGLEHHRTSEEIFEGDETANDQNDEKRRNQGQPSLDKGADWLAEDVE